MRREDGSWLLAGAKPADDMAELLKLTLPERRDYHTVAGFALVRLGRFPRLGDAFEFGGWRFEVVDIDGRRRVLHGDSHRFAVDAVGRGPFRLEAANGHLVAISP